MKAQIINDVIVAWGDGLTGAELFDIPDDYSPEKYAYTVITPGVFNPNGFSLKTVVSIDQQKRAENINKMSEYMAAFVVQGQLTQANYELFMSDISAFIQPYINGSGRLITWIETTNRNGYNASTSGFKTKSAYRGSLVNGLYERAEAILAILNRI